MASARSTTRTHQREEGMTETLQQGLQQGKEMLVSVAHDGGDKMLALSLLLHAAISKCNDPPRK